MNFTQRTGFVIVIILGMVIISRLIVDKYVSGKLEQYLLFKEYDQLEKTLDTFLCKVTYTPFRREMMRLNGYSMQENVGKVDAQFKFMFEKMRLTKEQIVSLSQRGFYYYMDLKDYKKAKTMLQKLQESDPKNNAAKMMEIMYDILAKKESKYIHLLTIALDNIGNNEKNLCVIEYLLALQYSYIKDQENVIKYAELAKEHSAGSEYEQKIDELLKINRKENTYG
ncbi:MAG: hypothetical protein ACI4UK_09670 [Floccifex sp.]